MARTQDCFIRQSEYTLYNASLKIFQISARILIIPDTPFKNRITYKSYMTSFRIEHHGISCMSWYINCLHIEIYVLGAKI